MPVRHRHPEKRPLRDSALRLQLLRSEARRDCAWSCRLRKVFDQTRCSACRSRLVAAVARVCKSIDRLKQKDCALLTRCLSSGWTLMACSNLRIAIGVSSEGVLPLCDVGRQFVSIDVDLVQISLLAEGARW